MKSTVAIYILFVLQILMCAFLWSFSIYHYTSLPEIIPIHYSIDGSPDGFGDKNSIFIFPFLGTILFYFMNRLSKNPYSPGLNLSEKIKSNPTLTRLFVSTISTWILLIFSTFLFQEVLVVKNIQQALSPLVFFLVGGMVIFVIVFNLYYQFKK